MTILLLILSFSLPTWAENCPSAVPTDCPPVGRSLFDQLFVGESGEYELPPSFPELKKIIESHLPDGKETVGVLIPSGRSRQRFLAFPDFLRFPRVVLAVDEWPRQEKQNGRFFSSPLLRDRLFLGYLEPARQLEVISFNEAAGRFEFQVVENFGDSEKTPQVFYAHRKDCLSCHQSASPIFSEQEWDETNASGYLAYKLFQVHGKPGEEAWEEKTRYMGVKIRQPEVINYDHDRVGFSQDFDHSTDRAPKALLWPKIWKEICPSTEAKSPQCRAQHLKWQIAKDLKAETHLLSEELLSIQNDDLELWNRLTRKVDYPISSGIENRDPTWSPGMSYEERDAIEKRFKEDPIGLVNYMMSASLTLEEETHPATQREIERETYQLTDSGPVLEAVVYFSNPLLTPMERDWLKSFCREEEKRLHCPKVFKALDHLALDSTHFNRSQLVQRLFEILEPNTLWESGKTVSHFPEVGILEPLPPQEPPQGELRLVYQYCAHCHAQGAQGSGPTFLSWNKENDLERMRAIKENLLKRLDWKNAGSLSMPPEGKESRHLLDSHPEELQALKEFIESL